jgi:hypothetical protein
LTRIRGYLHQQQQQNENQYTFYYFYLHFIFKDRRVKQAHPNHISYKKEVHHDQIVFMQQIQNVHNCIHDKVKIQIGHKKTISFFPSEKTNGI